ncbi:MAG: nucleoside monophosphate kinase [Nitrospirota bacterium]
MFAIFTIHRAMTGYTLPIPAILLLGPTGSGKSPLGDHIARAGIFNRSAVHLDFGAELRSIAAGSPSAFSTTELEFIGGVLERGLLLEDEHFVLAEKIIRGFLDRTGFDANSILVLNGIPRHAGQARDIDCIASIHAVIALDCCSDDVFCRLRENVGGDRTERIDDHDRLVAEKLRIYRERTEPLIDHYVRAGSTIYRMDISSSTTTDESYRKLLMLAAGDPPVSLITEPPQR